MDKQTKSGFRIGNFVFWPETGELAGARGTHRLPPELAKTLVLLADQAGSPVKYSDISAALGLDSDGEQELVENHITALRDSLGDTGIAPRFLLIGEDGVTLIAPVRLGTGKNSRSLDDISDADESVSFFAQLQRRKVIRVAAGYVVVAWLMIQVGDTVLPAIGMPNWTVTLTIAIAMLGFPIAIIIAWLYEVTSIGTLRDKRRAPISHTRGQKLVDIVALTGVALIVVYFSLGVFSDVNRARDASIVNVNSNLTAVDRNTIAVLPFTNNSSNSDSAYIGDGVAEEILRLLSRIQELRVTARTASFFFKDKPNIDVQTIANKLRVRHLLTGSVQVAGEAIRINAELLDAVSGQQLWSGSFDRKMVDIFDIQSEIARAVAEESEQILSAASVAELRFRPTENLEAYDYYLRGRDYLRQPHATDVLENALRLFHRALALDPGYALALAGLCETHLGVYILTKSTATIDDAESDCRAALENDSNLPEVHTALGYLYWRTGQFDKAEVEFRTAIDMNGNFFEAYSGLGDVLTSKNDQVAAESAFVHLTQLQPAYWRGYHKLGGLYYQLGDDPKALPNFLQVTELTPDNAPGWNNLGSVQYMLGDLESAANAWRRAIEIKASPSNFLNLGTMYYYLGQYEESVNMHRRGLELAPDDYRMWGRMAAAYNEMGNRNAEAISAYARGIEKAKNILAINPNEAVVLKNIALFYAHLDQDAAALEAAERALSLAPEDPDTRFFAALTFLRLGDSARCIEEIIAAIDLGYSKDLLNNEPVLDDLRNDDRLRVHLQERLR